MLGEGTYGMVFKCRHRQTGRYEAIKLLRYDEHCDRFALAPGIIREINILRRCIHQNIVELYGIIVSPPHHIALRFELMQTDLRKYICDSVQKNSSNGLNKKCYGLSMDKIKQFTLQILISVRYAHGMNVVHRDLKPQNLLVNETGTIIKIGDWGLARALKPRHSHALLTREVVTLWYRSPELLLGCQQYDRAVDIWSIGVIIYHMTTGCPLVHSPTAITTLLDLFYLFGTPKDPYFKALPFYSEELPQWQVKDLKSVIKSLVSGHPETNDEFSDFLSHLLAIDPSQRWTARQAIWHPFLDDVRSEMISSEKTKTNKRSC